jgi:hypothetical protein
MRLSLLFINYWAAFELWKGHGEALEYSALLYTAEEKYLNGRLQF